MSQVLSILILAKTPLGYSEYNSHDGDVYVLLPRICKLTNLSGKIDRIIEVVLHQPNLGEKYAKIV